MWSFAMLACAVETQPADVNGQPVDPESPTTPEEIPPTTDPAPGGTGGTVVAGPALTVEFPVWDPMGDTEFSATLAGEADDVWLEDMSGERFVTFNPAEPLTWDGRDEAGAWAATGSYTLVASGPGGEATVQIRLVRPGIVAATWISAGMEPLFWSSDGTLQDELLPFVTVEAIDDASGILVFPAVSADLLHAPDVLMASPVALPWNEAPVLSLDPAAVSSIGNTGFEFGDIEVTVDGGTVLSGSPVQFGVPIEIQWTDAAALTVEEGDITVRFHVAGHEVTTLAVPYRMYRLLGPVDMGREGLTYHAWTSMIDPALRAIDGVEAEHDAVASAVTEWVYYDLGLTYDTMFGASKYSEYGGFSWDEPRFYARDFLTRAFGNVINCSDAGNIVITYANMLGAPLHHIVILENYDLNFLLAIGGDDFVSCPFGPGVCGFSYHAVATDDGAVTVWDATAAVDGDEDPGQTPNTLLLVQALTGEDYLFRLVRSGFAEYDYESVVELQ